VCAKTRDDVTPSPGNKKTKTKRQKQKTNRGKAKNKNRWGTPKNKWQNPVPTPVFQNAKACTQYWVLGMVPRSHG